MGISLAIGGDNSGIRFTGNANFSQERENADGSAWSESIISAGNNLSVTTGNDTTIIGGQLEADKVTMDIGNDLNIQSLQDTDNYDYEKLSASVSGSAGFGGWSANLSLAQTEMESNWASVTDQSGIYAGSEGFDITVGNNTDLKGAVIASSAEDKSKNSLETGTISFENIENKADFDVNHISISIGTGGGLSPTAGAPTIYHHSGSDSSTTQSAVEEGTLVIRDTDKQQQNVADLNRDTTNANNPLGQIFDKQKEQDKMDALQLVNDIAAQVKDVTNKADRLEAQQAVNDNPALAKQVALDAYNQLSDEDKSKVGFDQFYQDNQANWTYQAVDKQLSDSKNNTGGMGSSFNKGVDAATSVITGLITGDITGGLAGASAPYLANLIKEQTGHYDSDKKEWVTDDKNANLIAHAILGGVVAQLQGNSALAGAGGAAGGEFIADQIREQLYGKDVKDLNEAEKQNISNLAQLATGLATAVGSGGNVGDIGSSVNASKNSVENNALSQADFGFNNMTDPLAAVSNGIGLGLMTQEEASQLLTDMANGKYMYDPLKADLKRLPEDIAIIVTPYGDYIAFRDAETWGEYAIATAGVLPFAKYIKVAGKVVKVETKVAQSLVKEAEVAYKSGNITEGNRLMNQVASQSTQVETTVIKESTLTSKTPSNPSTQASSGVTKPVEAGTTVNAGKGNAGYLNKPEQGGTLNIGAGNKPIDGAYNISNPAYPMANGVHAGDVNDLSKIATGSQKTIIMENPNGFKPFNDEVLRVLDSNGTIVVKGSWSNPSIKNLEKIADSKGFKLVEKNVISSQGYSQSSGKPIMNETITEYIFKRK